QNKAWIYIYIYSWLFHTSGKPVRKDWYIFPQCMVQRTASVVRFIRNTHFPLRLTFLAQRSPFQDIHFALSMPQSLCVTFLHLFECCPVSHGHVHQSVQQDHVLCISVPTNRHYYREHDTFQLFLYTTIH